MKKKSLFFVVFFAACAWFAGCKDDDYSLKDINTDNVVITPSIQGPITKCHLNITDIFTYEEIKGQFIASDGVRYKFSEKVLDTIKFPLHLASQAEETVEAVQTGHVVKSSFQYNQVVEDFTPSKYFEEGGLVDSLGKLKLSITITKSMPFATNIEFRLTQEDTAIVVPTKNETLKMRLSADEKQKKHDVILTYADTKDLLLTKKLKIHMDVVPESQTFEIKSKEDSIAFDVKTFISGRFLIKELDNK